jgi:hypothetical protein
MAGYRDKIDRVLYSLDEFPGNPKGIAPVKSYLMEVLAWDPEVVEKDWEKICKKYAELAKNSKIPKKKLPKL